MRFAHQAKTSSADWANSDRTGPMPLANPDEVRTPDKTRFEIVRLEEANLGRFSFQPDWRWLECIKPVVKTDTCQLSHVG